jgi:serine protease Do
MNQEDNKESLANTAFISEKIKQRPINRKKLFRRTVITVSLAVIFGIVACFTFLFLQPVFSDRLYPENAPEAISFPEETASEELTPEEMFADDREIAASEAMSLEANQRDQIDEAISSYSFNYRDYGKMMASLKSVATQASRSIVKVTAISSDTNWFSDSYESSGQTSGLIVANSGNNLFILVPSAQVVDAESIGVTFCDNTKASAVINQVDTTTNLCVLNVKKSYLSEETLENILTANLGSSNLSTLTGLPVIALGSPIGIQGSISYGIITSEKTTIDLVDSCYKLITTDIVGSKGGTGILVTLNGNVVGIIDMSHNPSELPNSICAIGITELKSLIEDLSNGKERGYLGIHGTTVPDEIQKEQQVPAGAYISKVEMSSPAMKAGVQSGDIITAVDDTEINTYEQLINKLAGYSPDDIISITVMRQAPNDYIEIIMEATLTNNLQE